MALEIFSIGIFHMSVYTFSIVQNCSKFFKKCATFFFLETIAHWIAKVEQLTPSTCCATDYCFKDAYYSKEILVHSIYCHFNQQLNPQKRTPDDMTTTTLTTTTATTTARCWCFETENKEQFRKENTRRKPFRLDGFVWLGTLIEKRAQSPLSRNHYFHWIICAIFSIYNVLWNTLHWHSDTIDHARWNIWRWWNDVESVQSMHRDPEKE